ncbi:MAG: hypothetical protein DRH51_00055 [Candidatus Coatesbacteria bacterium]|nr:MAG: hypothetical protein DRH51_00055 [Candidatus Coatesbacteria bacterium]
MSEVVMKRRRALLFVNAGLILIIIVVIAISIGPGLSINRLPHLIMSAMGGGDEGFENAILSYRVIRVLLAVITGFVLSYCGATLQITLNNPLADPYLLGLSAGAGFGASLSSALSLVIAIPGLTSKMVFAFIGGVLAVFGVYRISRIRRSGGAQTIIITGIIVSSFLSAAIIFMLAIAPFRDQHQILLWLLGDLSSPVITIKHIVVVGIIAIAALVGLIVKHRELDILSGGEEQALYLGVSVEVSRRYIFTLTALATGAVVSLTGLIGFIGIVVPHASRAIIGPQARRLLPFSALVGGITLLTADTISRILVTYFPIPAIPVGVITAFFGAPYFLYVFTKGRRD